MRSLYFFQSKPFTKIQIFLPNRPKLYPIEKIPPIKAKLNHMIILPKFFLPYNLSLNFIDKKNNIIQWSNKKKNQLKKREKKKKKLSHIHQQPNTSCQRPQPPKRQKISTNQTVETVQPILQPKLKPPQNIANKNPKVFQSWQ